MSWAYRVLALLLLLSQLAEANESSAEGTGNNEAEEAVAIYGEIHDLDDYRDGGTRSGHVSLGPFSSALNGYFSWKERLLENTGINYMIEISPQLQWNFGSEGGSTSNNETNLIGQWSLIDKEDFKRGGLMAWYQLAHTLGSKTTTDFQSDLGILMPINGGDTFPDDSSARLMLLAWEQWFQDETIRLDVGKLTTRVLLDLNRYNVSDREDFYTPMIVNNPVVPYTARVSLGVFAQFIRESWYLSGMIRDADGTSRGLQFNTLDSGNWEYAAEFAWTPKNLLGLGKGMYRFIPYYTDSIGDGDSWQPAGWTASLSFDQDLGESFGAAFRYAWAEEGFRSLQQRAAFSFVFRQPLGFANDRVGLGVFWGKPADRQLSSETGAEVYWKLQISPSIEITPGLQIVFNPVLSANQGTAWIGELRLRLVL